MPLSLVLLLVAFWPGGEPCAKPGGTKGHPSVFTVPSTRVKEDPWLGVHPSKELGEHGEMHPPPGILLQ